MTKQAPVFDVRDVIYEGLLVRKGMVITEAVARERAANIATALLPLLEERGRVVTGTIEGEPRSRYGFDAETADEHARRVIK